MNRLLLLICLFLASLTCRPAEDPAWLDLLADKGLSLWDVPEVNPWWQVQDGVLTGKSDPAKKGHTLWTKASYQDVEVACEFRFEGDIDSGIFLRKPSLQVQIGTSRSLKRDMTASIYIPKKGYDGKAEGVDKLLKLGEWNQLKIRAQGETFTVWLNGQQVLEYTSSQFPGEAPVGLQIHPNVDMSVEFRNLKLRKL